MRVACHMIAQIIISGVSKFQKTLIYIINISTGKQKQKERAREKRESVRRRKRERYPARVHSCTVYHYSFLPFVNSSLRSPMHMPHIPVSFGNFLMCSAVHREATIYSIFTLPSRAPILAQMLQPADLPQQRPRAFCN